MKTTAMSIGVAMLILLGAISAQAEKFMVREGDTPSSIARRHGVTVKDVLQAANISDPRKLRTGTWLDFNKQAKKQPVEIKTAPVVYAQTTIVPVLKPAAKVVEITPVTSENVMPEVAQVEKNIPQETVPVSVETPAEENVFIAHEKQQQKEKKVGSRNKFVEASLSVGGWKSLDVNTSGIYGVGEVTGWVGNTDGDQNYGLGVVAEVDKGFGENHARWGSKILAAQPAFWKNFDDKNFLLLKPRIGYRWNDTPLIGKPEKGMTWGGYGEVSRIITPIDLGIIAADGWHFTDDSYAAARIWWERMVSDNWKVKIGVGPVGHWSRDDSSIGISPAVTVKYNDTVTVGVTGDTSKGGPFIGGFITVDYNSDIHHPFKTRNKGERK